MSKKKNITPFRFAVAGVTTEQFAVTPEKFDSKEKVDLSLSFNFKHNEKEQMIGTFLTLNFHQPECKIIVLEVGCHFKIHPDSWSETIQQKNVKLILPLAKALHLATITTGTARGVLHARLTNTPFAQYVLPAVNLTDILKEDVQLNTAKAAEE